MSKSAVEEMIERSEKIGEPNIYLLNDKYKKYFSKSAFDYFIVAGDHIIFGKRQETKNGEFINPAYRNAIDWATELEKKYSFEKLSENFQKAKENHYNESVYHAQGNHDLGFSKEDIRKDKQIINEHPDVCILRHSTVDEVKVLTFGVERTKTEVPAEKILDGSEEVIEEPKKTTKNIIRERFYVNPLVKDGSQILPLGATMVFSITKEDVNAVIVKAAKEKPIKISNNTLYKNAMANKNNVDSAIDFIERQTRQKPNLNKEAAVNILWKYRDNPGFIDEIKNEDSSRKYIYDIAILSVQVAKLIFQAKVYTAENKNILTPKQIVKILCKHCENNSFMSKAFPLLGIGSNINLTKLAKQDFKLFDKIYRTPKLLAKLKRKDINDIIDFYIKNKKTSYYPNTDAEIESSKHDLKLAQLLAEQGDVDAQFYLAKKQLMHSRETDNSNDKVEQYFDSINWMKKASGRLPIARDYHVILTAINEKIEDQTKQVKGLMDSFLERLHRSKSTDQQLFEQTKDLINYSLKVLAGRKHTDGDFWEPDMLRWQEKFNNILASKAEQSGPTHQALNEEVQVPRPSH